MFNLMHQVEVFCGSVQYFYVYLAPRCVVSATRNLILNIEKLLLTVSFFVDNLNDATPSLLCFALWSRIRDTILASLSAGICTYKISFYTLCVYTPIILIVNPLLLFAQCLITRHTLINLSLSTLAPFECSKL